MEYNLVNNTELSEAGLKNMLTSSIEILEENKNIQLVYGEEIYFIDLIDNTIYVHQRKVNLFKSGGFVNTPIPA